MNNLNLLIPVSSSTDIRGFIDYWQNIYSYKKEYLYSNNISTDLDYSTDNIKELYEWKNGSVLSGKKDISLSVNILSKMKEINDFRRMDEIDTQDFLNGFECIHGAVWKIFLLHIIKPNKFPIYDQHIHRAYNYIHGLSIDITNEIKHDEKLSFYFEKYLPFIDSLEERDLRKIDKALFAFGKLLNTQGYKGIVLRSAPNLN